MVTDAQKRAHAKYNREKMVQRVVRFSPNEKELLWHLDAQGNRAGYIKQLIADDMERKMKDVEKQIEFVASRGEFDVFGVKGALDDCMDLDDICDSLAFEFGDSKSEEELQSVVKIACKQIGIEVSCDEICEKLRLCLQAKKNG